MFRCLGFSTPDSPASPGQRSSLRRLPLSIHSGGKLGYNLWLQDITLPVLGEPAVPTASGFQERNFSQVGDETTTANVQVQSKRILSLMLNPNGTKNIASVFYDHCKT